MDSFEEKLQDSTSISLEAKHCILNVFFVFIDAIDILLDLQDIS